MKKYYLIMIVGLMTWLGVNETRAAYLFGSRIDPALGNVYWEGELVYVWTMQCWLYGGAWNAIWGEGFLYDSFAGWVYTTGSWGGWFWAVPQTGFPQGFWAFYIGGYYPYRYFWVPGYGWQVG